MINVALIGAGYWGTNLARVLEESPELKLVCSADPAPDRGNCTVDDVLAREDIDAVVIATPASTHCDLVIRSLSAGKHVLVEKPLALSFDDAAFCCDLADENHLRLMVDLTYRYSPGLAAVSGALVGLGEPVSLWSTRMHHGGPDDVNSVWDLFPHDLAIVEALCPAWLDQPPKIQAIGDGEAGTVWLKWPGRSCVFEYSRRSLDKTRRIDVATADGTRIRWIDHPTPRVFIERPGYTDFTLSVSGGDEVVRVPVAKEESLRNMIDAFADSVLSVRPSPTSGRSSLRAIGVIEQVNEELG